MAPTCSKQMNLQATLCIDIQLILYWVIAQQQHHADPAWDYWCANRSTEIQAT